jgi:hypothetical protein
MECCIFLNGLQGWVVPVCVGHVQRVLSSSAPEFVAGIGFAAMQQHPAKYGIANSHITPSR